MPSVADHPAFFSNAQSPTINGGVFAAVQGDAYFGSPTPSISERRGMKLLLEHIASGAFHDAAERGDPPKCHKDTRKSIIKQIMDWVTTANAWYYSLLWMNGPAGAGKSAIMQTIAEMLVLQEILVGSFFFARTAPERNNPTRFIATLAYQLALAIPEIQEKVVDAIEADPTVFTRKLAKQAEVLIIQPLKDLNTVVASASLLGPEDGSTRRRPRVFLVDALDECVSVTAQREVLDSIGMIADKLNDSNTSTRPAVLFVLASRPEYEFRNAFSQHTSHFSHFSLYCTKNITLQPNYDADLDIELFLQATFQNIKKTHPIRAHLPQEWPAAHQIKYLVDTSSSQFIYAATAAKYIDSPRHNPLTRLNTILEPGDIKGKDTPFSPLDGLYRLVLGAVTDLPMVLEVLTFLILRTSEMTVPNIQFVSTLFGFDPVDVRLALTDMYALMNVPATDDDTGDVLRLHHASMVDFLTDASRSGEFYIDPKRGHTHLTALYVRYLTRLEEDSVPGNPLIDAMITGFIAHYPHASWTDELQWALDNFKLGKWLRKMTMTQFYNVNWSDLFAYLKEKVFSRETIHRHALVEFDKWVLDKFNQYPEIIRTCIPAAYNIFPQHFLNSTEPIFSIIMARQSDTQAVKLSDTSLFRFQDHDVFEPLAAFFNDRTRAGVYSPTETNFKVLAREIIENIFPRDQNPKKTFHIHIYASGWSPPYNMPYEGEDDGVISLHDRFRDFHFFEQILTKCPRDMELATFLRDRALQISHNSRERRARSGKINVGKASLQYIKDCDVSYLDHDHIPDLYLCTICEDLKANSKEIETVGEAINGDDQG